MPELRVTFSAGVVARREGEALDQALERGPGPVPGDRHVVAD